MTHIASRLIAVTAAGAVALALSACAVGPDYHRPDAPVPTNFLESRNWVPASPAQVPADQAWWMVYNDPVLDNLERQVAVSNQTIKADEAAWRAARAQIGIDRGGLFPTLNASASKTRTDTAGGFATSTTAITKNRSTNTSYQAGGTGSWQIDLWGKIRRTVESDVAQAEVSQADLAAAQLSLQATLAEDYFSLRTAEEQLRLYDTYIQSLQAALKITQNRVKAGVTTLADVYSAQTELESVQAQEYGVQLTRAQMVHAIAVLVGKPPEDLSVPTGAFNSTVPVIPPGVPSELLQRRPDIAAAERNMASANAQVGVARAAYYPSLTLSASYSGIAGSFLHSLLHAGNSAWSIGPTLAQTVFNGGTNRAQNRKAEAAYDQAVASYRATVLAALQQVEDDLASLRLLSQEAVVQEAATQDARKSEALTLNQYKSGIVAYSSVITAQTTRITSEISLLALKSQQLASSVNLIAAVGGGWKDSDLRP